MKTVPMKTVLLHIGVNAHEISVADGEDATDAATRYLLGLDYAPGFDWVADSGGYSMRRGEKVYNNPNIANGSQVVWLNVNSRKRPTRPGEGKKSGDSELGTVPTRAYPADRDWIGQEARRLGIPGAELISKLRRHWEKAPYDIE